MIKFLNWLFRYWNYQVISIPRKDISDLAKEFCEQVQEKFPDTSGEFKRSQVLRMLLNRFPQDKESQLALAIEHYVSNR